mmetsp:Transcript_49759/g.117952  ORF Transcript_49759/g.117952 Transcript_49759/m.117952 type:complete len:347 (+) Transcript_49759:151-1191(+)
MEQTTAQQAAATAGRNSSEDDDRPSSLIIIFDMNRTGWAATVAAGGPSPQEVAESLLTFIRAFFLLHGANSITVLAAHAGGSEILYQSQSLKKNNATQSTGREVGALEMDYVDGEIHAAIVGLAQRIAHENSVVDKVIDEASVLSSAFAMAACMCNRLVSDKLRQSIPRVFCIVSGTQLPGQYIPIMNSVFSFQKAGVLVDSLVVSPQDCSLLQQASDITHGVYLRPSLSNLEGGALVQWLLSVFLSDRAVRYQDATMQKPLLRLPRPLHVDYRSSCFKSGEPVDVGFVCSVCLSIFKDAVFVCPTCESKIQQDRPAAASSAPSKKRKTIPPKKPPSASGSAKSGE